MYCVKKLLAASIKKNWFNREYKITAAFSNRKVETTHLDNLHDIEKLPMDFREHISIFEITKEFADESEAKKYFEQFSRREECWQCNKIKKFLDCKADLLR